MPDKFTFSYRDKHNGTEITMCKNGKPVSSTFLTSEEMKNKRKVEKAKADLRLGFV